MRPAPEHPSELLQPCIRGWVPCAGHCLGSGRNGQAAERCRNDFAGRIQPVLQKQEELGGDREQTGRAGVMGLVASGVAVDKT